MDTCTTQKAVEKRCSPSYVESRCHCVCPSLWLLTLRRRLKCCPQRSDSSETLCPAVPALGKEPEPVRARLVEPFARSESTNTIYGRASAGSSVGARTDRCQRRSARITGAHSQKPGGDEGGSGKPKVCRRPKECCSQYKCHAEEK
jgi:hypothetical protein